MITLLALILRLLVLAAFTFGFVVLYEHGTKDYQIHAKADALKLQHWVEAKLGSDPTAPSPPPEPAATAPSAPSGASDPQNLQSQPMEPSSAPGSSQ